MNESLSALVDAELDTREQARMLQQVAGQSELRAAWERYHLVSGILKQDCVVAVSPGFSDRVLEALAAEDAPAGVPRGRHFVRLALAASVTAVAALFGLHLAVTGDPMQAGSAQQEAVAAPLPAPQPFIQRAHFGQTVRWAKGPNSYLLEHPAGNTAGSRANPTDMHIATYDGGLMPAPAP